MTVFEYIKSLNGYPILKSAIERIALKRGLSLETDIMDSSKKVRELVDADVYAYLADAPDVSQLGVSYSFSDEEKANFIAKANGLYNKYGESESYIGVYYGYVGESW